MKIAKRFLLLGFMVFLIVGAGAAFAQDGGFSPHPGGHNTPSGQQGTPSASETPTAPTGTPSAPSNGTPHDPNHDGNGNGNWHWPNPVPVYSASTVALTCTLATQLEGKTQAEVAQTYSSLRAAIGSSDVLAVMPHGAVVTILSGPECSGGTYWYEVSYKGQTGWVTEGGDSEYWLEPVAS